MTIQTLNVERSSIAKAAQSKDKPDKAYEVRADNPVGLILRVQPSGSRTFYVQVARGHRVRIGPAGTFTLKQAQERAKTILRDPQTALRQVSDGITLNEYITEHYKTHAVAKNKTGQQTIDRIKAVWSSLLNKRLTNITAKEIDKARDKRILEGTSPSTVNRDVAALSGLLTHWVKNNKGVIHPLDELESLDVANDETIRYLTAAENKQLRKALAERDSQAAIERSRTNQWRKDRGYETLPEITGYSDHLTPMTLLSLNTGLRRGELFSLTWEVVDLRMKTITVLASHSKGNKTRVIPLNSEALEVLNNIKPLKAKGWVFISPKTGEKFTTIKKSWAELTVAAKIPDLRWHDLRHDFASQLVMRGVPLFTVQQLMGHSTPKMTMRYAKLAPGNLADAINLLAPAKKS